MEKFIKNLLENYVPVSVTIDVPPENLDYSVVRSIADAIYSKYGISTVYTQDFIAIHGLYYPRMIKFVKEYLKGF